MYGGLFGDLPAAKKDADKKEDEASKKAKEPTLPAATLKPTSSVSKPAVSVVQKLGAAGTSMAFVPTQAARRRNKRPATTSFPTSTSALAPRPAGQKSTLETETMQKVVKSDFKPFEEVTVEPSLLQKEGSENEVGTSNQEPEEIRRLHALAKEDPYDPFVPNDLVQYWERKALAEQREKLERERLATMEEQQKLRQVLEEERRDLIHQGNYNKLVAHQAQHGAGRGRGLSNLPAWLVEKQRKEAELAKTKEP